MTEGNIGLGSDRLRRRDATFRAFVIGLAVGVVLGFSACALAFIPMP